MPLETTQTSDTPPSAPTRRQRGKVFGRAFLLGRFRFLTSVLLLALIIWMGFEALSTWVVHTWLPAIVPISKIEKDIQNELARATQLEPLWEKWDIEPTLFNGLRITVQEVQLRENRDFLKERGVLIPTPKKFKPPVTPLPKTVVGGSLPVSQPAMAKLRRFELHFRYWPLIGKQHFQISRIQLAGVRLLGGANGVLTHYFPVFYDPDYGKKYFKKKDPPTYLADATFGIRDLGLYQISTAAVMSALNQRVRRNVEKSRPETVLLPVDRVGLDIQDAELTHLVSAKPLALNLKGRFGVFKEEGKNGGQALDEYYDRWNRVFALTLDSRITGDNPDKAFSGPWRESDLQHLDLRILSPADAPESLFFKTAGHKGIIVSADLKNKNLKNKNLKQDVSNQADFSPYYHDWQFEANGLDLSLLSDTFRSLQSLVDQEIGRSFMPFALKGKMTTRLKGRLLWNRASDHPEEMAQNALIQPPLVKFEDGYVSAKDISLAYQQPVQGLTPQSVNAKRSVPDTFLLDSFNGVATLKDYIWQLNNASLVLGESKMFASAMWNERTQTFNGSLRGDDLSFETLLGKFSKLEPILARYQPGVLTPEARQFLSQWRNGQLKITGLLDFNLGFNGNSTALLEGRQAEGRQNGIDYTGTISFENGNLVSKANTSSDLAFDIQNVGANIDIQDKIFLRNFSGEIFATPFKVTGEADKLFRQYSAHLESRQVDLQKVHRLLQQQLPPAQSEGLAVVEDLKGNADIRLSYVHTGNTTVDRINGSVLVKGFALTPALKKLTDGQLLNSAPVEFGQIPIVFDGERATLPDIKGKWGPIPLGLSGDAKWGNIASGAAAVKDLKFNASLETGKLPVALFRDHDRFFRHLFKDPSVYPHFWNTTGEIALNAKANEKQLEGQLAFYNAGASWREGDFPVYDVNGFASFSQALNLSSGAKTAPVISTTSKISTSNLEGRYGNSPIAVAIDNLPANSKTVHPKMTVRGRLSPLVLNHYLTAPQATYAPYQMVPFRLELGQKLRADLPANVYGGRLFMGLNRLLVSPPEENTDTLTLPPDRYRAAERSQILNTLPPLSQTPPQQPSDVQLKTDAERFLPQEKTEASVQPPSSQTPSSQLSSSGEATVRRPGQRAFILAEFGLNPNANASKKSYPFFRLYPSQLHLSEYGDLLAEGDLTSAPKSLDWKKMQGRFHLLTSPAIDIKGIGENFRSDIFKDADGKLAADVTLDLNPEKAQGTQTLTGWLNASKVALPVYYVEDITGKIAFEQQRANIDLPSVKFQGADLAIHAESKQALQYPIPLENVKIGGRSFNLPAIQQFNAEVVGNVVENVVRKFSRPWQEGDPLVPVQFKDADVNIDEVVYQNIILEHLKGKLTVLGNSFTQLSDTEVDLAGGKVNGYIEMNPFDNHFLSVDMKTEGVSANALTRAMLGVTNQVFGDVDANIRYRTQGKSEDEMLENANGTVKLRIANGRLPALSTVETLLTAANIIRGGILGFNFNNLIRAITPFRARYFADLSGDMEIADKRLHTQNLLLDGENLDLLMKGTVTMDDGQADMMIDGSMNQTVSSGLGFIGKLSPGNLLRIIPILGFNPFGKIGKSEEEVSSDEVSLIADPGLLYRIPGLGYIPGLGGPVKDVSRFRIKMQGPPQDQASIKSFTWLTEKDLKEENAQPKAKSPKSERLGAAF
ncbi:MAG: AsmA-like C-terminal region-containing protein [Vampirovibrionales bacterium]|nr:AsmA-like C-terminal region-containing protein [Vampirovibrionales bacterium]